MSAVLGVTLALGMSSIAFAADNESYLVDEDINIAKSKVSMEVVDAEKILIATVPLELPIIANTRGEVTIPDNAKIINHADTPIKVAEIKAMTATKDIRLADNDFISGKGYSKPNLSKTEDKRLWVSLCDTIMFSSTSENDELHNHYNNILTGNSDNGDARDNWKIPVRSEIDLNMDVEVSKGFYETATPKEDILEIQFTIAFDE